MNLTERIAGALYGQAIGDGMGAPVEGWPPEKIAARFQSVKEFLPPTHSGDPAKGKGAGRFTDDTLMAEALIRAYLKHQDHLDAYGFNDFVIPEIAHTKVWVPEYQQDMAILGRLHWPEKYPWIRLAVNNAEPRSAGIGNCVNCGVAMYMLPVGAVNAGDPEGAYQEAAALGQAHNESFAVEAGAVMAAACAAAFAPRATPEAVFEAALELARDGTRAAIRHVLRAVVPGASLADFITRARKAVKPYVPGAAHVADDTELKAQGATDLSRPSRTASIEELPVALGALRHGAGDFDRTLHAAVFYGRDCDSIGGMAGALFGALHGVAEIPEALRKASDLANRRDLGKLAAEFAPVAEAILRKDAARLARRQEAISGKVTK